MTVPGSIVGEVTRPQWTRRPAWLLSLALDGTLAIAAYFASYWLRFPGEELAAFLPGARSTLPIVVGAQLVALAAALVSAPRTHAEWLFRVAAGVTLGTASAAALVGVTGGFSGVSRLAFLADALVLTVLVLGWRFVWVLATLKNVQPATPGRSDLIDRAEEMTTLGATVASLYRYRELLKNLVIKDLKLKYRGSVFGFLWSLANPLLMIIVYTIAFTYILPVRSEGFVFYLMLGVLSWTFFANSAAMSTGAIVDNSGLLKSVFFPRAILPVGTVLFNLAQYLLTVAVFLPVMMLWYHAPLARPMILFPVFLALQTIFTIGVALILATSTAFFRDVKHLLEVALAVMFWTTPIVYELRQVPERLQLPILLSPMSPFVVAYQKLFYFREWPEPSVWLVAVAYSLGAFIVGATLMVTFGDRLTEQV